MFGIRMYIETEYRLSDSRLFRGIFLLRGQEVHAVVVLSHNGPNLFLEIGFANDFDAETGRYREGSSTIWADFK